MKDGDSSEKFRIDRWLCAARFFKTRSVAADAVECGQVLLNQGRIKPAREVAIGDMLDIRIGQRRFEVEVLGLSVRRGPATQAQKLYRETEESHRKREELAAQRKQEPQSFLFRGRPTKRDRREIDRFKKVGLTK